MSSAADILRAMFKAIDAGRWEELKSYFADDVCYERPGYPPICGIDSLMTFYREVRIIDQGEHQIWHIVAHDDAAACWGRFAGRAKDGRPLEERFADVYELRKGRVARRATHFFRPAI